jgi:hypothetical protein
LAFSYWIDYLGFITEEKLAAIFIKPSLGVSNWPVIYIINYTPAKHYKFSGTVTKDRRRRITHTKTAPSPTLFDYSSTTLAKFIPFFSSLDTTISTLV